MSIKALQSVLVIILILVILLTASFILSQSAISISQYDCSASSLTQPLRIVQLTDLHNSVFGKGNERLIRKVREQQPDLIFLTGDMLNQYEEWTDVPVDLIRELCKIAPVYASYGNHEQQHEKNYGSDIRAIFTEAGATVLEYDWVDVEVKGQKLRIGGIYGYCMAGYYLKTDETDEMETAFLDDFCDTDRTKLLLCHMPVAWI